MNQLQNPLVLVGRVLLALMFVLGGFSKIGGFAGTVGYMQSAGVPAASLLAVLAIVLEIGGGLALLVGLYTRRAALTLGLFTLLVSFIFHKFWVMPEAQQMVNQLMFLKNLAVAGGMFALAAFGAGTLSLDARRSA